MKYQSQIIEAGDASFPEFTSERVYMVSFYQKQGLPESLKRWQFTVDQMLMGIKTNEQIFIMIDQSLVKAGVSQRRPGLHIDGYWMPSENRHGSGGHKGKSSLSGRHQGHRSHNNQDVPWEKSKFDSPEAIILASNISAAKAYEGSFSGPIQHMGNCEYISTENLKEVILKANKVYRGNITCLHESVPVIEECQRTLVRLNVPGVEI